MTKFDVFSTFLPEALNIGHLEARHTKLFYGKVQSYQLHWLLVKSVRIKGTENQIYTFSHYIRQDMSYVQGLLFGFVLEM